MGAEKVKSLCEGSDTVRAAGYIYAIKFFSGGVDQSGFIGYSTCRKVGDILLVRLTS